MPYGCGLKYLKSGSFLWALLLKVEKVYLLASAKRKKKVIECICIAHCNLSQTSAKS